MELKENICILLIITSILCGLSTGSIGIAPIQSQVAANEGQGLTLTWGFVGDWGKAPNSKIDFYFFNGTLHHVIQIPLDSLGCSVSQKDVRFSCFYVSPREYGLFLKRTTLQDEGNYSCSYSDHRITIKSSVDLEVRIKAKPRSPTVLSQGAGTTNSQLILTCDPDRQYGPTSPWLPLTHTWYMNNNAIPSLGRSIIVDLEKDINGSEFQCTVQENGSNFTSEKSLRYILHVNLKWPTIVSHESVNDRILYCDFEEIHRDPRCPSITEWYKNDKVISSDEENTLRVPRPGSLSKSTDWYACSVQQCKISSPRSHPFFLDFDARLVRTESVCTDSSILLLVIIVPSLLVINGIAIGLWKCISRWLNKRRVRNNTTLAERDQSQDNASAPAEDREKSDGALVFDMSLKNNTYLYIADSDMQEARQGVKIPQKQQRQQRLARQTGQRTPNVELKEEYLMTDVASEDRLKSNSAQISDISLKNDTYLYIPDSDLQQARKTAKIPPQEQQRQQRLARQAEQRTPNVELKEEYLMTNAPNTYGNG